MPVKNDREYRAAGSFAIEPAQDSFIVEGYASTFEPYVLYEYEGRKFYERIDRKAFDLADMSDVIMQYDHVGRVYARQKNGTLQLSIDDHGLKVRADLSSTEGSRQLYADIKAGLILEMSFAFTVDEDSFDRTTSTRNIYKIRKVYDVSAVSIPANPGTTIAARSYVEGVIAAAEQERLKAEARDRDIAILKLKLQLDQEGEI